MKHVVNIAELHKLVPETQQLEGVNFKDMKALIETVIKRVEESGNWEYVQYIAGNPSLFVVKEREYSTQEPLRDPYENYTDKVYDQSSVQPNKTEPRKAKVVKTKTTEPVQEEQKSVPLYTPMQDGSATGLPEIKMPWS